ncbi:hypothetical protein PR048_021928 [Dryococelus australis]|uniref:Uncharacterized protein n=1 Tax=Dryococelus australis TaxID=614101 RepID=A0ABQ9GZK3_9NEOP|nr:hypothetical protein PR048_021928 [Dryococelus australis]
MAAGRTCDVLAENSELRPLKPAPEPATIHYSHRLRMQGRHCTSLLLCSHTRAAGSVWRLVTKRRGANFMRDVTSGCRATGSTADAFRHAGLVHTSAVRCAGNTRINHGGISLWSGSRDKKVKPKMKDKDRANKSIDVNWVQSTAGSLPDFHTWESCRTMPLVGGFSQGSSVSPAFAFRRCSILTSITLIDSQDLAVKSHPDLFTRSIYGWGWVGEWDVVRKMGLKGRGGCGRCRMITGGGGGRTSDPPRSAGSRSEPGILFLA